MATFQLWIQKAQLLPCIQMATGAAVKQQLLLGGLHAFALHLDMATGMAVEQQTHLSRMAVEHNHCVVASLLIAFHPDDNRSGS